jgi:hypothetical protein
MALAAKSRKRCRKAADHVAQTWCTRQAGDCRLGSDVYLERRQQPECGTAGLAAENEVRELAHCTIAELLCLSMYARIYGGRCAAA